MQQNKETIRIFMHGFVQGVGFRRWIQDQAMKREISGWVRNRGDGTVEALLHGEPRAVGDLVRACGHGPDMARVDKVMSEPAEYDGLEDFRIESNAT